MSVVPAGVSPPKSTERRTELSFAVGDWPAKLALDGEWAAARHATDDWPLLRLSRRREALREQIEKGGPGALVAFRAWPWAPEAWVERGVVCRVLPHYQPEDWGVVLRALRQSADRREVFGEAVDVEAEADCRRALEQLSGRICGPELEEYEATRQALSEHQSLTDGP